MNPTRSKLNRQTTREFLVAAALQEVELVCYFVEVEGLHPDTTMPGKPTALCYSAMTKNHLMLDYLVKKGADINYRDVLGMTPLHYAVLGACVDCTAYLVRKGARLDIGNRDANTPLALALNTPAPTALSITYFSPNHPTYHG